MEVNTPIADDIRTTDQNAQYDAACRKLLAERIILAWIMKSCLEEYRDCDVKEIAEKYIEGTPQVGEVAVMPGETNATKIRGILQRGYRSGRRKDHLRHSLHGIGSRNR